MKDVISRNYAAFIVYLPAQRVAERIIHLAVALTLQQIMLKPDQQEDHADKNQQHDQHLYYYCKKRRDHDVLDKQLLWLVILSVIIVLLSLCVL